MTSSAIISASSAPTPTGTPLDEIDLTGRRWHVVVVKPLVTDRPKAVSALLARGYQVLAPMCREVVIRKGRCSEADRPMFGRYVFAGSMPGQEARKLALVPSVSYVSLDSRRRALVLQPGPLAAVVARLRADGGIADLVPRDPAPRYLPGQSIRVTEGPFAGFSGLFVADEGERLRVLLGLFGGQTEATVPVVAVEAAE
jgi:Transcription antiterminator